MKHHDPTEPVQGQPHTSLEFQWVADHPALDLLNTTPKIDGAIQELFQTDRDVVRWLGLAGWRVETDLAKLRPRSLLDAARGLRETIRTLVERRKAGKRADPEALNEYLAKARSYAELALKKDGSLELRRKWKQRTAEEILAPLAESAADLLVHGDVELIRQCESEECVLWFNDRTKSHHRRWCSMAACGNRHKVAQYRKRQQAEV